MDYYYVVKISWRITQYCVVDEAGRNITGMFKNPTDAVKEAYVTLKYFMEHFEPFCIIDDGI